jgi:hypothetical protein
MKIKFTFAAIVFSSLAAINAHAQPELAGPQGFVGINYAELEQHDRFFGDDRFSTGEIMLRAGGYLSPNFVAELRIGTTVMEEESGGVRFRNEHFVTGLLRIQKEFGPITPYLGVGYSAVKEELPTGGDYEFQDWSYAIGLDLMLGEKLGINGEIFVLSLDGEPNNNVDRKGPSVGVFYKF